MKTSRIFLVVLLLLSGGLAFGVMQLFNWRFERGDVYPPYSSFRADPLGTRALYESLDDLPDITAQRNILPLDKLIDEPRQTVMILGVESWYFHIFSATGAGKLESLPAKGDRLVISMLPVLRLPEFAKKKSKSKNAEETENDDEEKPISTKSGKPRKTVSLTNRWEYAVAYARLPGNTATNAGLWHTTAYFDQLGPKWKVLERFRNKPVAIERKFGSGTIVLCADSYLFSNEALRRDRDTELLSTIIGTNTSVVFDETHFGVQQDIGVMQLARKYRLHGLLAGILLLAGLFIWKNMVTFVPPYEDPQLAGVPASGKDAAAGFVNLLRRSIPASKLLPVCFAEWEKSFAHAYRTRQQKLRDAAGVVTAQNALPARQRNPVTAYRAIKEILQRRK